MLTTSTSAITKSLSGTQNFSFPFPLHCSRTLLTILSHKNKLKNMSLLLVLETLHLMSKVKPFSRVNHIT